jgi:glycosyltransferase involved in cell wall biosynthesis
VSSTANSKSTLYQKHKFVDTPLSELSESPDLELFKPGNTSTFDHNSITSSPLDRRHEEEQKLLSCRYIGYAEGNLGLGQSFRDDVIAAVNAKVPVAVFPFRVGIKTRLSGPFMPHLYDTKRPYPVNVIVVATDQIPAIFGSILGRSLTGSYNILRTYWELPDAPKCWRAYLTNINEIWAPNDFVANAFRNVFSGPIRIVPTTVDVTHGKTSDRSAFGMDEDRFYFLYNFDYFSSPYRKNPLGLLQAFQQAFGSHDEKVGLVIKSIGPEKKHPKIRAEIQAAMMADPRIIRIHRTLERDEMLSLIRASDAYVSLHRSEGFGAGMAEAMMMGKIVIGTDFSGSKCFLNEQTGFPVPYTIRAVQPHEYPWSSGQVWAEPVISEAVLIMRRVFERPEDALHRAVEGERFIKAEHSYAAVGQVMRKRLAEISKQKAPWRRDPAPGSGPLSSTAGRQFRWVTQAAVLNSVWNYTRNWLMRGMSGMSRRLLKLSRRNHL